MYKIKFASEKVTKDLQLNPGDVVGVTRDPLHARTGVRYIRDEDAKAILASIERGEVKVFDGFNRSCSIPPSSTEPDLSGTVEK